MRNNILEALMASVISWVMLFTIPNGPNEAACTEEVPCSLAHALTVSRANDVIVLGPGTYKLENSPPAPGGPISIIDQSVAQEWTK